jgi:pyridoxine/pyridoxamine 5'-phosphate oxidase
VAERDESTLDTILHLKRQDPFVSFEVVMTSGDRFHIEDPDALAVATSQLHYYPRSGSGIHMRLNQIAAVEERNGKRPPRTTRPK